MSSRFNVVLSDELNAQIERAASESETTKSEVLRKAFQLFLAAYAGKKRGLKVGLIDPETDKVQTEIIGL